MPRILGYSFNPLVLHYAYNSNGTLVGVILEVSNTFGEAHIYCLPIQDAYGLKAADQANNDIVRVQERMGYNYAFKVKRRFHVSPFNDLSGHYIINLTDPTAEYNFDVNILYVIGEQKKFVANVKLKPAQSWFSLLQTPFQVIMTIPRIFYEAFLLAYFDKMAVYPKPVPQTLNTVKILPPEPFEKFAMKAVSECDIGVRLLFKLSHSG